jgi:DNA primase
MVVRRVRESAGAPADRPRTARTSPTPPARDDPRLHRQREALKAALQVPAIAGPGYDELPDQAFTHPVYVQVHRAVQAAGGVCGGREGPAWLDAVLGQCSQEVRGLVAELAVEPLELPQKNTEEVRYVASIVSGVRLAMVDEQIAEIKSRLQRTNPVDDADAYLELFGDLVPLEQYRIALREKAMGAVT